jgi:hypothetical protein
LFSLIRIADANAERKELARIAKEQAEAFEAATVADAQKAREEADAATTEEMVANVAIETITRLGLDAYKMLEAVINTFADTRTVVAKLNNHYVTSPDMNAATAGRSKKAA